MTMYMPPLSTKKRSESAPEVGLGATRRVFGNYDEKETGGSSTYASIYKGKKHAAQPQPRVSSSSRHNKPHPEGVGFLLQDCATLHDPICDVKTKVNPDDTHWWPSRANENTGSAPAHTKDTISRNDYKRHKNWPKGQTRHGSNPNTMPAQGPVPITHLPNPSGPRLLVEHISYQHGYDSRSANNQPQRGKLHGNFVWDVLHPRSAPNLSNVSGIPERRNSLPGRGSKGMQNILTHDLTYESNAVVRKNQFPNSKVPLKPIAGKVGETCVRETAPSKVKVQLEGQRSDTVPDLPSDTT